MNLNHLVNLLFQQYKYDCFNIYLENGNKLDNLTELDYKYGVDIWNIVLDILGYPPESKIGEKTDDEISRDWLSDPYLEIFEKGYDIEKDEAEIKIDLYKYLQYLSRIIEDYNNGIDIQPYFENAVSKSISKQVITKQNKYFIKN